MKRLKFARGLFSLIICLPTSAMSATEENARYEFKIPVAMEKTADESGREWRDFFYLQIQGLKVGLQLLSFSIAMLVMRNGREERDRLVSQADLYQIANCQNHHLEPRRWVISLCHTKCLLMLIF